MYDNLNAESFDEYLPHPIYAAIVQDGAEKLHSIIQQFGVRAVFAEHKIYSIMSWLCENYHGGVWDFYELCNGGWFMAPSSEKQYTLVCPGNGWEGTVSAEAAGIIASLYLFGLYWHDPEKYERLLDYAEQHPESPAIFGAID